MLNGRNFELNDFTSISVKGSSVVDYCLVGHDNLSLFSKFSVTRVTEIVNVLISDNVLVPSGLPDHSILSWNIKCDFNYNKNDCQSPKIGLVCDKFNVTNVPHDFLSDVSVLSSVNTAIADLEGSLRTQDDIDVAFNGWCDLVKGEMYARLPCKPVMAGVNNKKRRHGKPWWSKDLSEMWNNVCITEKEWLKCTDKGMKKNLKIIYCSARRLFDKEVQRSKRTYWFKIQTDILDNVNDKNQNQFWKNIGHIGIINDRKKLIPMEVLLDQNCLSTDTKDVLAKWKNEFSNLLTSASKNINVVDPGNQFSRTDDILDAHFSILEVKNALDKAKKGKAFGVDLIPVDVLNNDTSVIFACSI